MIKVSYQKLNLVYLKVAINNVCFYLRNPNLKDISIRTKIPFIINNHPKYVEIINIYLNSILLPC